MSKYGDDLPLGEARIHEAKVSLDHIVGEGLRFMTRTLIEKIERLKAKKESAKMLTRLVIDRREVRCRREMCCMRTMRVIHHVTYHDIHHVTQVTKVTLIGPKEFVYLGLPTPNPNPSPTPNSR